MNSLISVNKKFMEISPSELARMVKGSGSVKGLELSISDYSDNSELEYLDGLVLELKKNDLILQIHGE